MCAQREFSRLHSRLLSPRHARYRMTRTFYAAMFGILTWGSRKELSRSAPKQQYLRPKKYSPSCRATSGHLAKPGPFGPLFHPRATTTSSSRFLVEEANSPSRFRRMLRVSPFKWWTSCRRSPRMCCTERSANATKRVRRLHSRTSSSGLETAWCLPSQRPPPLNVQFLERISCAAISGLLTSESLASASQTRKTFAS